MNIPVSAVVLVLVAVSVCGAGQESDHHEQIPPALVQEVTTQVQASLPGSGNYDVRHCLRVAETRDENDKPITCECRDAIVDARYMYFVAVPKEGNLRGVFADLQAWVKEACGRGFADYEVVPWEKWKWEGPEVVRKYPRGGGNIRRPGHHEEAFEYTLQLVWNGGAKKSETWTRVAIFECAEVCARPPDAR